MCNLTIHPTFIGYHKCGYANCPVCKNAITNSQYWYHIRSHPGHENDNPPLPREKSEKRGRYKNYGVGGGVTDSSNSNRRFDSSSLHQEPVQPGKEYEAVIT
jgi:hypothetical protein